MERYSDPLPSWQKELLRKRREQQVYNKRTTDVLENRLSHNQNTALKSPTKTADIIKFFNTVADGDSAGTTTTCGRYPGSGYHLASKPDIKAGEIGGEEGVARVLERPTVPDYPTRHGAAHLHRLSSLQAEVSRTQLLTSLPPPESPSPPETRRLSVQFFEDSDYSETESVVNYEEEEESEPRRSSFSSDEVTQCAESAGVTVGSRHMGEDKRLFLSNGRSEVESRVFAGGVGSKLHRSRQAGKRNVGRDSVGGGDSDGMMGSGGDSDSSEEIHYGPGFVSRLKSRYMSVALRGSARGSLGTLRRTASLEDFLDLERNKQMQGETVEEQDIRAPLHRIQTNRVNFNTPANTNQQSKVQFEINLF